MVKSQPRRNFLRIILSLVISVAFISYIYVHRHSMGAIFRSIDAKFLALIIISQIAVQLANAELLRISVTPFLADFKRLEAFRLTLAASSINFFTPVVGGIGTKALYLKRHHKLDYAAYTSVIYANYLISFLFSFLFGLTGLAILHSRTSGTPVIIATLFFGGGAVLCLTFMFFSHKFVKLLTRPKLKNNLISRIVEKIIKVNEGWEVIRTNKRLVLGMSIWSAIAMASTVVVYAFVMRSLNIPASTGAVLILGALGNVSLLFNITPGNIGIRESIYASVYTITGIKLQSVVTFSLLERSTLILILGFGWLLFGRKVLAQIKKQ